MAAMMNAANLAYRKAVHETREKARVANEEHPDKPSWLQEFEFSLPENSSAILVDKLKETEHHRKERLCRDSEYWYGRFAFLVYERVTKKWYFEAGIMASIMIVAIATAADLENEGADPRINTFVTVTGVVTTIIFTLEVILKMVAEGFEPLRYFHHPEDGYFNIFGEYLQSSASRPLLFVFTPTSSHNPLSSSILQPPVADFTIVVATLVLMSGGDSAAIGGLRILRLVRLMTLVKNVAQLRAIISG